MTLVSLTLPNDGETIDASDVNGPFNTIASALNGNLDDQNISTLSGTKITAGTLPSSALTTAFLTELAQGWSTGTAPSSVTYNGNRSYDLVFNGVDLTSTYSPGTRIRTTRGTAAPTQSTSLNGTTQYWVKSSPNKMTFTDDFVVSVWIKLTSYPSADSSIVSRYNGTSGWQLYVAADGVAAMIGRNAGPGNFSQVRTLQSIPLNKWVHITAQLDMSAFTATSTTSYVMFDGVDVPAAVNRGGTNPTALVQAGNLEIGAHNGGLVPLPGKLSQVAIFNSKVAQATIRGYVSQGLLGTETNLASAYSFNGVATDLNTTTPNDLSVGGGSAVATEADSPFGGQASGLISSTLDYAIVQASTFSTNTTLTVQVSEGCTIPTSGSVSALSYSAAKVPSGFPAQKDKWTLYVISMKDDVQASPSSNTWYSIGSLRISVPVGSWALGYQLALYANSTGATVQDATSSLSTSSSSESTPELSAWVRTGGASGSQRPGGTVSVEKYLRLNAQTIYYAIARTSGSGLTGVGFNSITVPSIFTAENAYL